MGFISNLITDSYSIHGVHKPANITGGHHPAIYGFTNEQWDLMDLYLE